MTGFSSAIMTQYKLWNVLKRERRQQQQVFFKEGYRRITDDEASYAMRDFFGNRIRSDPECTRRSPCFLPSFTLFLLKDDRPFSSGWKKIKREDVAHHNVKWMRNNCERLAPAGTRVLGGHHVIHSVTLFFSFFLSFIYPHSIRIL